MVIDSRFTRARFEALGLVRGDLFEELRARYAEPHRAYHTARHIDECLAHLDDARHLCERPVEVEIALWFHDAIYDPRATDNEARSAEWACSAAPSVCDRVRALILMTRHNAAPATRDEEILVDIDLSILGADEARFREYETQVRAEYSFVDEATFRQARGEILRRFLARPSIYRTELFRERLEDRARRNIKASPFL